MTLIQGAFIYVLYSVEMYYIFIINKMNFQSM